MMMSADARADRRGVLECFNVMEWGCSDRGDRPIMGMHTRDSNGTGPDVGTMRLTSIDTRGSRLFTVVATSLVLGGWTVGSSNSEPLGPEIPGSADHAVADVVRHITLDASTPEDEQTVDGEVSEVRLFFSDAPLMRGASIRIVNASRQLQRSTPPVADEVDPKQLSVQLPTPLPAGTYVVQWRCIADDGHVMRGDFTFEVSAQ
jgi:methionine-rich copper-binding protein CopC